MNPNCYTSSTFLGGREAQVPLSQFTHLSDGSQYSQLLGILEEFSKAPVESSEPTLGTFLLNLPSIRACPVVSLIEAPHFFLHQIVSFLASIGTHCPMPARLVPFLSLFRGCHCFQNLPFALPITPSLSTLCGSRLKLNNGV